jgi:hypothetical protein
MFKKILIVLSILILPIVLVFLIYINVLQIVKPINDFNLSEGKAEEIGIMEKFHKGSFRSPNSSSEVFFVKIENNDTLYSYFTRDKEKISFLKSSLIVGKNVKIFNDGFDEKQNTVDIIELELNNSILISKRESDKKNFILISLFLTFLILYFYIPYKFVYLKSKRKK